jgi:3',5'-cyclic AMP phosphodiesterase CpdA
VESSIAHFSDIHLCGIKKISIAQLLSKRLYGYFYWKFSRSKRYDYSILEVLINDLKNEHLDHVVVTGDLAHLSLPEEFISVKRFLRRIDNIDKITLVPGNHDFYVPAGKRYYEKKWKEYISTHDIIQKKGVIFPFVRFFNNIALVGVNSAVITPPFFAYGFLGRSQIEDLKDLLAKIPDIYFTILLIHHPPVKGVATGNNSLVGMKGITEIIKSGKIKLILHGHTHYFNISGVTSKIGEIPVIGVPPAVSIELDKLSGYNIYYIKETDGKWRLTVKRKEFSLQRNVFEVKDVEEITIVR